jgi:SAM-dependent methyltransferase
VHEWLASLLVDPAGGGSLRLADPVVDAGGDIESGNLLASTGCYEVRAGIPRFTEPGPTSTSASFSFKWSRRAGYEPPSFQRWYTAWLLEKYGFADLAAAQQFFSGHGQVLEVGCGSGLSSVITRAGLGSGSRWVGLDLTDAIDIAQARLGRHADAAFVQADLLAAPFPAGTFDVVFAEGVLHHTPSTIEALEAATALLRPGGEILFYVYARKAPVREWTDDYLRAIVSIRSPADAWDEMRSLTSLARALADLQISVEVPEDVPLLGIKAGTHDVQRLIYWHFAKLYWNDDMGFEGSQAVNFDWYHPPYAHRHTLEEIKGWCARLDLDITYSHVQESGYTVRARKGAIS